MLSALQNTAASAYVSSPTDSPAAPVDLFPKAVIFSSRMAEAIRAAVPQGDFCPHFPVQNSEGC